MSAIFTPPSLTVPNIVQHCKEIFVNIREADFDRPEARRWMEIYSNMFNIMTRKTIEDAMQIFKDYVFMEMDYKEIFDEGLSQIGFTLCIQRLMCSCGMPDFSVQDVVSPSRKRLIKIMSALINKCFLDTSKLEEFERIKYQCVHLKEESDRILGFHRDLKNERNLLKESEPEVDANAAKIAETSDALTTRMRELNPERDAEDRGIEVTKLKMAEMTALKEKYYHEKKEVQKEHDKISMNIVQSPEKFLNDQERLKNKVEDLKKTLEERQHTQIAERQYSEQITNKKNVAEKALRLTKEVLTDLQKATEISSEIQDGNERLQELQEEYSALCTECSDVNDNTTFRQSTKHTLTQQLNLKKQCNQQQKEGVNKNCEMYQEKLDKIKSQEDKINAVLAEGKQASQQLDKQFEQKTLGWENELADIYQEIDILHNSVANACQAFKETFEN